MNLSAHRQKMYARQLPNATNQNKLNFYFDQERLYIDAALYITQMYSVIHYSLLLFFRYDDAKVLLEKMGGDEVPPEWRGNITGITYRLGGIMEPAAYKVRLSTHNYFGE